MGDGGAWSKHFSLKHQNLLWRFIDGQLNYNCLVGIIYWVPTLTSNCMHLSGYVKCVCVLRGCVVMPYCPD